MDNTKQDTIETLSINGREYVPKDSVGRPAELGGLKYAIVRSIGQGVMAGFVKSIDGRRVTLLRARQLWRFSCPFVLVDLAEKGTTPKWENKFSCESSQEIEMLEACGVLYCTEDGMNQIRGVAAQTPGES